VMPYLPWVLVSDRVRVRIVHSPLPPVAVTWQVKGEE
jgi:hypothetical protein